MILTAIELTHAHNGEKKLKETVKMYITALRISVTLLRLYI